MPIDCSLSQIPVVVRRQSKTTPPHWQVTKKLRIVARTPLQFSAGCIGSSQPDKMPSGLGPSPSVLGKLFDSDFRVGQAGSGIFFPVAFDGGDLLAWFPGQDLKFRGKVERLRAGNHNALMFEEGVQLLLYLVQLALQLQDAIVPADAVGCATRKHDYNAGNDGEVTPFQNGE